MEEETFTLEEIKRAFWANFYGVGEIFFDYLDNEETNNESVEIEWNTFLEELKKTKEQ